MSDAQAIADKLAGAQRECEYDYGDEAIALRQRIDRIWQLLADAITAQESSTSDARMLDAIYSAWLASDDGRVLLPPDVLNAFQSRLARLTETHPAHTL